MRMYFTTISEAVPINEVRNYLYYIFAEKNMKFMDVSCQNHHPSLDKV